MPYATGSLTFGYFGNSAAKPNTNNLYLNRFLSFQITRMSIWRNS
ncbi:hypothetical protein PPL_08478 [Heterostelium album PN500]|uniref:Uncharacterized protein n=1 Tax=Heterostelium pallidum (strain ATCC 26659 / Pp 5 / PN500) TaxID=670386 RepID=D3BIB0_HETP5|nr:hypothetical protein PPL_08478 [Heterostelium album PN500]EFA79010.1 hypothetical protein PPL_08478 [Heterostelium album PN500]|eukprot:XP_020431134.1 hypothetical protein PPL_08478 [Heterostelium album PN500]